MFCRIYTAIPFLREMRLLLDWWVSKTSLSLDDWMTLDSMKTDLYNCGGDDGDDEGPVKPVVRYALSHTGTVSCIVMRCVCCAACSLCRNNPRS